MTKICLEILRRASAPICNRDIALAFHEGARHGIPTTGGWSRCSPSGSAAACASTATRARWYRRMGLGRRWCGGWLAHHVSRNFTMRYILYLDISRPTPTVWWGSPAR
jgi:hypothetical protein